MMLDASVIICTHNPRPDYFARVLDGLRNQTHPLNKWELLIVDNASQVPVAKRYDISWQPAARHLFESKLGLSWARLRGIQEASADLIIFVDDDNVLDENYLAEAVKIAREWPPLGAWGAGVIRGDFEVQPPEDLLSWLPVREVSTPRWSNLAGIQLFGESPEEAIPWGAGLCVRKQVAVAYHNFCRQSSIHITGRRGAALIGGEDTEICFVCCSHGLGVGVFPELKMIHLIPRRRVSEEYLIRFAEGASYSNFILTYKWKRVVPQSTYCTRTLLTVLKTVLLYRGVDRRMRFAWLRALAKANGTIKEDLRKNHDQIQDLAEIMGASRTEDEMRAQ
jgi:glycosyltransferase involved in cell wall biosynthesis